MNVSAESMQNTRLGLSENGHFWRYSITFWVVLVAGLLITMIPFYDGLLYMYNKWMEKEEYSHAILLPFIAGFLLWQKKDLLSQVKFEGSWLGLGVALIGFVAYILGNLATLYTIIEYAFIVVLMGLVLSLMGLKNSRHAIIPMFILFLAIPLPNFIYHSLSAQLQLLSSALGVEVIRLFGISVYLHGNVIDLGSYQLQVVEACSGLRYLFPLMTLGFIVAYFFKAPLWQRAIIFFSSIPITVGMNSFRIGVIGVMVEYWGNSMAEGFLHDFEGWVVFMACTALMLAEVALFARLSKHRRSFNDVLNVDWPEPTPNGADVKYRQIPLSFYGTLGFCVIAAFASLALDHREERIPDRQSFDNFPMHFGDWIGFKGRLDNKFIDVLKFEDYIVANYHNADGQKIDFYVAYYNSQRSGESIHSPKSCLPADGWEVSENAEYQVPNVTVNSQPLSVNRVLISKGDNRQLVYYWFQQRGRVITNEYAAKWYLFWDSLTRQRTDGALVRLIVPVASGMKLSTADATLSAFIQDVQTSLPYYIPN